MVYYNPCYGSFLKIQITDKGLAFIKYIQENWIKGCLRHSFPHDISWCVGSTETWAEIVLISVLMKKENNLHSCFLSFKQLYSISISCIAIASLVSLPDLVCFNDAGS